MEGCLSKVSILGAHDALIERVEVPEWGGHVYVRRLSGVERDRYEESLIPPRGGGRANLVNIRARLCVQATCDEDGNRLFDDADANFLGQKSAVALDRVFDAAQRLNGLRRGDVEELAKNSAGGPSDASTTD